VDLKSILRRFSQFEEHCGLIGLKRMLKEAKTEAKRSTLIFSFMWLYKYYPEVLMADYYANPLIVNMNRLRELISKEEK